MNEEILFSRRKVLRDALALGGGFCLALVLPGCDSGPGASSPPAGAAPPSPVPQAAARKATHAGVQYQLMPKGEQKCSNCRHFIPEFSSCKLVDGQISPEAWCIIWAKLA
jgi:hypothetical protein